MKKYVLVTGAGGGLGLALTKILADNGFTIIACEKYPAGLKILEDLNHKNILPILLDVTDQAGIKKQFEKLDPILSEAGLHGLINNAGVMILCPLEFFPKDFLQMQFEINTLGVMAITQAAIPYLRKAKGKVINIGSSMGRYAMPFLGAYSASKFALRALTQTLRLELKAWDIAVTFIEAGNMKTPFWQKALNFLKTIVSDNPDVKKYYGAYAKALIGRSEALPQFRDDPAKIGRKVLSCLMKDKLKAIYVIGKDAWTIYLLNKFFSSETVSTMASYVMIKAMGKGEKE